MGIRKLMANDRLLATETVEFVIRVADRNWEVISEEEASVGFNREVSGLQPGEAITASSVFVGIMIGIAANWTYDAIKRGLSGADDEHKPRKPTLDEIHDYVRQQLSDLDEAIRGKLGLKEEELCSCAKNAFDEEFDYFLDLFERSYKLRDEIRDSLQD